MQKKSFVIESHINKEIKLGDRVWLVDGSSLTCNASNHPVYIVNAYPVLTGSHKKLHDLVGTITQIGNTQYMCTGSFNSGYLQDCVVKYGDTEFRTASNMVRKI